MSGQGAGQGPPGARPSVGAALLLLVAVVVGFVVWVAASFITGGPRPADRAELVCDSPPPPPTSIPSFSAAPDPSLAEGTRWTAIVHTTCGAVTIALDGATAPASVASFIELARAGYYDNSVCNRLTSRLSPTRFLQCGDPTGRRDGDPGYDLPLENVPSDRRYPAGTVAIARGPEVGTTAGEFLLVYETFTVPPGEPAYSVVGEVVSGSAVIEHIAAVGGEDHMSDWYPFRSISIRTVDVARRP